MLRPGQLVFKLIDLENRATSRVGFSRDLGLVSSAYIVASTVDWLARYGYWFYTALYNEGIFNYLGSGVRSTLNADDLRSIDVPIPSGAEQELIVDFLDRETEEIEAFIADQQKLIALLGERRSASLLQSVLGRSDYELRGSLGRFLRKLNRTMTDETEVITAFRDGVVTARSNRREEGFTFSETESGYQAVRSGDLVFHGLDGFSGATGVSESDGKCSPVYHVCSVSDTVDSRYAAVYLRALGQSGFLGAYAWSVRQRSVDYRNWKVFSKLPLNFPGLSTQCEVVARLERECAEIDAAIAEAREAIALSKERRVALISATVMGKIDVSSYEANALAA